MRFAKFLSAVLVAIFATGCAITPPVMKVHVPRLIEFVPPVGPGYGYERGYRQTDTHRHQQRPQSRQTDVLVYGSARPGQSVREYVPHEVYQPLPQIDTGVFELSQITSRGERARIYRPAEHSSHIEIARDLLTFFDESMAIVARLNCPADTKRGVKTHDSLRQGRHGTYHGYVSIQVGCGR